MPRIKKESVILGESVKLLNKIRNKEYQNRLKSNSWKDILIGQNIGSTLGELYFLIKSRDILKKNESLQI